MPKLKLTYFDMNAGRGEAARIALEIAGVQFEDVRVPYAQWPALKPSTPFGALPVLEVDGVVMAQSNTINRYVGRLSGLYPEDALQAAFCDEVMDAVEDIANAVAPTFSIKDEAARKAARIAFAAGPLTSYLKAMQARLEAHGGEFFADGRLTVADIKVFLSLRHVRSGGLDHVPADLPDKVAPLLVEHSQRVMAHPKIAAYHAERGIS